MIPFRRSLMALGLFFAFDAQSLAAELGMPEESAFVEHRLTL